MKTDTPSPKPESTPPVAAKPIACSCGRTFDDLEHWRVHKILTCRGPRRTSPS